MTAVTCPSCEEVIRNSDGLKVGQNVQCRHCYESFFVLSLNPIALEWSDVGDWDTNLVSSEASSSRLKTKASTRAGNSRWFGESDDEDWSARSRRSRKKKRSQRPQRRRSSDDWYQDF
jgi:hypothetical protein